MYEPLKDFETQTMPERKLGFWQMAGPGAVLVGLSIGAGEIIVWPLVVAEYGASMVWAAVMAMLGGDDAMFGWRRSRQHR